MAIANGLALPTALSNGTTADASQVMGDFNYLLAALNRALLDQGGGNGMNAQNTQLHNLANGTSSNDAVNLSQINGYAPLAGAIFTGGITGTTLSLSSTLSAVGAATLAALTASGLITGNAGFAGTTLSLSGVATLQAITGTTLNLSGAATLSGGGTSTTPSPGDNSTAIATTAFVNNANGINVQKLTSSGTVTPTFSNDMVDITAQAAGLTLANPTGTAVNGWGMLIRIRDNGTPRSISYGGQYVGIGFALPSSTVASSVLVLGMIYNSTLNRWEVISAAEE